jgi:hypothetical protein
VLQQTLSTQLPVVHSLLAPQSWPFGFFGVHTPPAQYCPDAHWASLVQPPEQTLPLQAPEVHTCVCGGGHDAEAPVQFAGDVDVGGLPPQLAFRHDAELGLNPFGGHVAEVPVQFAAKSHRSAAARHWVVPDMKPSVGQVGEDPVQFSATSQPPGAAGRQTVEA